MGIIDDALRANATIANGYDSSRVAPPAPKVAIVTCADPRLSNITQMLGLADADVDMIRNVGSVIDDDSIRSLLISTRVLGSQEIMIINHTGCGITTFTDSDLEYQLRKETGAGAIAPSGSTASRTSKKTPGSRSRRRGHIPGSPRKFP